MANDGPNAANLEKHLRYLNEQEACVAVIVLVPQGNSFLYDKFFMQELTIIKRENLLSSKIHYVVGWHEYVENLMKKRAKQTSPHGRGLMSTGKSAVQEIRCLQEKMGELARFPRARGNLPQVLASSRSFEKIQTEIKDGRWPLWSGLEKDGLV